MTLSRVAWTAAVVDIAAGAANALLDAYTIRRDLADLRAAETPADLWREK